MRRCVQNGDGSWTVGDEYDIVSQFKGLRYAESSGMRSRGAQKNIYTESFAESEGVNLFIGNPPVYEQTEITLTLYFLNNSNYYATGETAIDAVSTIYNDLLGYFGGCAILFTDKVRKRKALMYIADSIEPSTDSLKGAVYIECSFKFTNKHGRTYGLDDTTLETELGITT